MILDPKKFALLTSAIAASIVVVGATTVGCGDSSVDDDEADSGSGSSGEATSSSGGGTSSSGGSSSGGTSSGGTSSSGGSSGTATDGGSDGGSCLTAGEAPTCGTPTGCLAEEGEESTCGDASKIFQGNVAAAVVACLTARPTCEGADGGYGTCEDDAVDLACPDATAGAFCTSLLENPCVDSDDKAEAIAACERLVPALTPRGKEVLGSCVDEFSCDTECFAPGGFRYLAYLASQTD